MDNETAQNNKTMLYFGALLHDVGKVVIRGVSGKGTHSELGASFLKDEIAINNPSFASSEGACVIEQVRYHHAKEISKAHDLDDTSLAFITYFADNVSAGMDRKNEGDKTESAHFDKNVKLSKIFNILNGHSDHNTIDLPSYNATRESLKRQLLQTKISAQESNSLLCLLEATCDKIPSSTKTSELVDVSLYDHAKTTAGIAACIYDYLDSIGEHNYRKALFDTNASQRFYAENMFLLVSCDMSGIQDFIYNISGSGALKQLRARSLYLELMMEHVVDELLDRLTLNRANLMYTGGGHAYLLVPNTQATQDILLNFQEELKQWFLKNYGTDLYMGIVSVACSSDDLANRQGDGKRFSTLFKTLAQKMSQVKASRYRASDIAVLNFKHSQHDSQRECSECHRSSVLLEEENICPLCASLRKISAELVKKDVFTIVPANHTTQNTNQLALPFDCFLSIWSRDNYIEKQPPIKRVYCKNSQDMGIALATHIWMGDYTAKTAPNEGISDYAKYGVSLESDKGINRLGVLRADVDNLGAAFASGFPADKVSISRIATLSRNLSYFFKYQINKILKKGDYRLQIIYSGGDDLFIVGNWSDVLYAALDINRGFKEFTGNACLTLSAGVGMFSSSYPIARMAQQTGELEDAAKLFEIREPDGTKSMKNAIALWQENAVFNWSDFEVNVQARKQEITRIFNECEKGKAFIYKMVDLLRTFNEVISAPRLAYLLARSFEGSKYATEYAQKFYGWAMDEKQRRCLIAALEWYVYSIRERG